LIVEGEGKMGFLKGQESADGGRRLERNGVEPDEVLKLGLAELKASVDGDLARGLALLLD